MSCDTPFRLARAALIVWIVAALQAFAQTRRVVLLYDERTDLPGLSMLDAGFVHTLTSQSAEQVEVYREAMDLSRFGSDAYLLLVRDYMRAKYGNKKIDVTVAVMGPALDFLLSYGDDIFPGTPIVFCGIDSRMFGSRALPPHVTGVLLKREFSQTLELVLSLHPDTERIVFVAGTSEFDTELVAQARQEFQIFEDRLKFIYLTALPLPELLTELAQLPLRTIVLCATLFRDGAGEPFIPHEVVERVAAAANTPVYGFVDQYLGRGIVGGRLYSLGMHGEEAARLVLQILEGTRPAQLPLVEPANSATMFDWRQLQRWNISERRLPPGSLIRFRPPSLWSEHKGYVMAAMAILAFQALMIGGLLVQRSRRRRAEAEWRESEFRFRTMTDTVPVMIWKSGLDRRLTFLNKVWLDFTGTTMQEQSGKAWTGHVHPEDFQRCLEVYEGSFERRENFTVECRLRRRDDAYRWVLCTGVPRFSLAGKFLGCIGSCVDISDRKEAEEAQRRAFEEIARLKEQLQEENIYLREELEPRIDFEKITGHSAQLKYVLYKVEQVSPTDATVLILGETGTGKEILARAIHERSRRKDRPLIKVDCATLPANLIESELFGHEKGAFTGASQKQLGRFEPANNGTIFLDEIGELPLELQPKLLRVLEDGEFERLGSSRSSKVDVRVLAATNRNLKEEVRHGRFREDLYYRLNVYAITLPPLRERLQDVSSLVTAFVDEFCKKLGKKIDNIPQRTLHALQQYPWPGNVRELRNVIERAVIISSGTTLQVEMPEFADLKGHNGHKLDQVERDHILKTLEKTNWRIAGHNGAAVLLGLHPSTLRSRIDRLGIRRPEI